MLISCFHHPIALLTSLPSYRLNLRLLILDPYLLTNRYLHQLPFPVDNEDHCDFRKLRSLLIRTHMLDLINTTEDAHYEAYRQAQMETRKFGEAKIKKLDNPKFKEEEEMLRKRFTEQVKMEEARFRQWEQHVCTRSHSLCLSYHAVREVCFDE
jgi:hypothetical protein